MTVLRRSNSKLKLASNSSSRTSSIAESDSYASVDLGTDKLPSIDTPEASHVCSKRHVGSVVLVHMTKDWCGG